MRGVVIAEAGFIVPTSPRPRSSARMITAFGVAPDAGPGRVRAGRTVLRERG